MAATVPPFYFQIDEAREHPNTRPLVTTTGHWTPTDIPGANIRVPGGASDILWYCDGNSIRPVAHRVEGSKHYATRSVFFSGGFGFWVLDGDATNPSTQWRPLCFEHDESDGYSSFMTNAAQHTTLRCHPPDRIWTGMLLPDVYHGPPGGQGQGALKGELAILLALIAFAMPEAYLSTFLPSMFQSGAWREHRMANGRSTQRGVIVTVWTCPTRSGDNGRALRSYEEGRHGVKYYR